VDFAPWPIVGSAKSAVELVAGYDYIAAKPTSRALAAVGVIAGVLPMGKGLLKGGTKITGAIGRSADDAVDVARVVGRVDAMSGLPKNTVANNLPSEAFHYTASKWADAIKREGLRPGSYATTAGNLSPLQAKLELALPPTRPLPDARIHIDLEGLRRAGFEMPTSGRVSSTVVDPATGRVYQMPGGGSQMQFPYAIPSEFIQVRTLK
jgi:hypothetical protein